MRSAAETQRHRDTETKRPREPEIQRIGDTQTHRHTDTEKPRPQDPETQRYKDLKTPESLKPYGPTEPFDKRYNL